ncbi:MAG TPA: response regulator [Terriglobia bacterium]|nr:response regulator [Terriglobia bacterium]
MKDKASALLVHDYEYPLRDLRPLLDRLGFDTRRARSCAEANFALAWPEPPTVVFTDTDLPDGSWTEIVALASQARSPVPVIVVSNAVDLSLYLDALEGGATEFIVPPFRDADINYVLQGAMMSGSRPTSAFLSCLAPPRYTVLRTRRDPKAQKA